MKRRSYLTFSRSGQRAEHTQVSGIPSTAEYTLEGVKISLDLLKHTADLVPIPYVRIAIEAAVALISFGENIQATVKHVDDLNKRVWALMLVMIKPFQGKAPEDIPPEMQKDVEQLTSDLLHIEEILRRIAAQKKFLTLIFVKLNEEKVNDCLAQLEEYLTKFQVSREINNAILFWEMATGIKAVHNTATQNLKVAEEGLEIAKAGLVTATGTAEITKSTHELTREIAGVANEGLQATQNGIGIVQENLQATSQLAGKVDEIHTVLKRRLHNATPLPSREMPTKPRFFYGRDDIVAGIIHKFVGEGRRHVALLGAGGMGKTSIALTVIRHDTIVEKFGDRRFWVPCVEGRSPTRFLEILASCLKISRDTGDPLSDILFELKASSDPRIILLDNFETPWNLSGHRTEIERILCILADLPHISLFVTMRSNSPPSDDIEWDYQHIPLLETDQARQLYNALHPNAGTDPALDALIAELGNMPLAITLMAQLGKKSGSPPSDLLRTWLNIRTNMLDNGEDAKQSINVSIALSIQSTPILSQPEALILLAALSMFPAGTQFKNLVRWVPDVHNVPGALAALSDTSLAEQRSKTVYIHPVIRSYVLHPQRFPNAVRREVRDAMYRFISEHKSEPGDTTFISDSKEIEAEETNIQSILLDVIKEGFHSDAVDALLVYCQYQYWTRPQLNIIEPVLQVSRDAGEPLHIAESLFCLGRMYSVLDHDDKAVAPFNEAKDIFLSKGCKAKAAQCFINLAKVYMFLHDEEGCNAAMKSAQKDLREIGDEALVADVLLLVGHHAWTTSDHNKAKEQLTKASKIYLKLKKSLGVAHCNYWISRTYYDEDNPTGARKSAEAALAEYERLNLRNGTALTLFHLCRILKDTQCYDEAIRKTLQGINIFQDIKGPIGVGQGLILLGQIYVGMGKYDEARLVYEQGIETYRPILETFIAQQGTASCLYGIAETYRYQSQFEDAERVRIEYEKMGIDIVGS